MVLVLLVLLPIRYSIERTKLFQKRDRSPAWVEEIKHLRNRFGDEKVVIFNSIRPIETMLYTDYVAYKQIPDSSIIDSLEMEGYIVHVIDP